MELLVVLPDRNVLPTASYLGSHQSAHSLTRLTLIQFFLHPVPGFLFVHSGFKTELLTNDGTVYHSNTVCEWLHAYFKVPRIPYGVNTVAFTHLFHHCSSEFAGNFVMII